VPDLSENQGRTKLRQLQPQKPQVCKAHVSINETGEIADITGRNAGICFEILVHQTIHAQVNYLRFSDTICFLNLDNFNSESHIINSVYIINTRHSHAPIDFLQELLGSVLCLVERNECTHKNFTQSKHIYCVDPASMAIALRPPRVEEHLAHYRVSIILKAPPCIATTPPLPMRYEQDNALSCYAASLVSHVAVILLLDVIIYELACYISRDYQEKYVSECDGLGDPYTLKI
jgi:hypothetical protein